MKNTNKIFNNILISLTTTVAITIFILSTIMYASFEQIALSLLYSSSRDNLTQVSYSIDFMTKTAKSLAQQIYYDPKIAQLLFFPADPTQEADALQQLDNYRFSNMSFINSIYVYSRRSDDLYLSLSSNSSNVQGIGEFYDKGMVDILDNIGSYKRFAAIPRRVPVPVASRNTMHEMDAYTFLYYESVTGGKPDGAVILNISEEWIRDTMNSLNNDPIQNTFIINNNGILQSGSKSDNMLADISKEDYVRHILSSGKSSGYIVGDVKGVKSLVTYVTLASTGWRFIMVTPYKNVVGKIKSMQYYTVLIGFIILFAGLLSSFLTTRKIYKPIDSVLEKLNSLKKEKIESANTLKQDLLRNLLQSRTEYDMDTVRLKFAKFDICLDPAGDFFIIILKIDYYSDFCNNYTYADRNLFKFAVGNIASEICSEYFRNEPVDAGEDHVAVLMNVKEGTIAEMDRYTGEISKNVIELVKKHLDISLSVTISPIEKSAAGISNIYYEALETSNYRLVHGHGCILDARQAAPARAGGYAYPSGKEEQLINRLMLGKTGEVRELYSEIIKSSVEYSYAAFNIALLRVFSAVNEAVVSLSRSNGFSLNYTSDTFLKELNRLETIDEINDKFFRLFDYVTACLNEKRNSKNDDLLNRIDAIIRKRYSDPNLCLNAIADSLDMSPVYLGRLFKNLTTRSVGDYINNYRMEVAKDLLEKTSKPISEITEMIGILNKSHFYTVFRQEYGVTPNEYRKSSNEKVNSGLQD